MIIINILLTNLSSTMENVKALIKKCLDANSKELIIRDTNLTSLPSEIGALTNLHTLQISWNNNLTSLPSEIGALTNLLKLYIYRNYNLTSLPSEIGALTNLQELYISGNNNLTSLPSEFGALTNLHTLDIYSNNNLTSLPSEIGALINLHTLIIWNNNNLKHPYDKSEFYKKTIPVIRILQAKAKLRYLRKLKAVRIIISHIRDWLWRPNGHMFERTKQHFFNSGR